MTLPAIAEQPITVQQDLPPGGDEDGDGVPNGKDRCPYRPGPLNNYGCPTEDENPTEQPEATFPIPDDSDGDGTADPEDLCPMIPGNGLYSGCVDRDQDDDGIQNVNDECPIEAGSVENSGCPDGVTEPITPVLPALPIEGCAVATQTTDGVFVRSEPTTDTDNIIDVLEPTQVYTGTERNVDNSWLYIASLDGWVASRVVRFTSDCENLPVAGNTEVLSMTPPDSGNPYMQWYCVTVPESYRWTPLQTPRPYPASQATDRRWDNVEGRLILEYGGQPVDATPTRNYGTGRLAYVPRPARPIVGFVRGWNKSQVASQTVLIASGYVEYRGLLGDRGDSYEGAIPDAPIEVYGPRDDVWTEACGTNPANSAQEANKMLHCVIAEADYTWTANPSASPASDANDHAWDNVVMYLRLYDERRLLATSGLVSDSTAPFTISLSTPLVGHVMAASKRAADLRTDLRVKGFVSYDSGSFEIDEDEFEGWLGADLTVYGSNDTWPEDCDNNPYRIDMQDLLPIFQIDISQIPSIVSTEETCYYYVGTYRNSGSSDAQVSTWFASNISSMSLSGTYTRTIAPGETDRILIADAVELVNFAELRVRTRYADGIEILDTIFGTQSMPNCENNRIYDGQRADNPD